MVASALGEPHLAGLARERCGGQVHGLLWATGDGILRSFLAEKAFIGIDHGQIEARNG
jgi:hypothetical protein